MDATYRLELRELNDLNFARFDARVGERFAELELRLERRFALLDVRFADLKAELVKWMFLFWAGTALTVIGLQVL